MALSPERSHKLARVLVDELDRHEVAANGVVARGATCQPLAPHLLQRHRAVLLKELEVVLCRAPEVLALLGQRHEDLLTARRRLRQPVQRLVLPRLTLALLQAFDVCWALDDDGAIEAACVIGSDCTGPGATLAPPGRDPGRTPPVRQDPIAAVAANQRLPICNRWVAAPVSIVSSLLNRIECCL